MNAGLKKTNSGGVEVFLEYRKFFIFKSLFALH